MPEWQGLLQEWEWPQGVGALSMRPVWASVQGGGQGWSPSGQERASLSARVSASEKEPALLPLQVPELVAMSAAAKAAFGE
jgi:hypothetical protein